MTDTTKKPFELTGYHVLFGVILFFGAIITVNMIFLQKALNSFPGEETKKSYMQGLNYNEVLQAREDQSLKGWKLSLIEVPNTLNDPHKITLKLVDKAGIPLTGKKIVGSLRRPTTDAQFNELTLTALANGEYASQLPTLDIGSWELSLQVLDDDGPAFSATTRIWINES